MKFKKICMLGLGYIGLPSSCTFATRGIKVVGVDVNPDVVNGLKNGQLHIHEPGLRSLVQEALQSGNLTISDHPQEADAFIIAVPTPFYDDKRADMRYVVSAAESILPYLKSGNLVVLESTSPPRTTSDLLVNILERSGLKAGVDFYLAYTPERVLPGQIIRELVENARVIGGINLASAEAGRDLYKVFVQGEIILTTSTTAEMVKIMENTYRDVNIAIANEFSRLADRFGVDIWEAISIASLHPRVKILSPGPGVGGHCISVDPWFLVEAAPDLTQLIRAARQVNDSQPQFVLSLVKRYLGEDLRGKRIAALGLTFKPNVDDFRESPALEIVHLLEKEGAQVSCYDPFEAHPPLCHPQVHHVLQDAVRNAEFLIFLVAHEELKNISASMIAQQTPARLILDTVNILVPEAWQKAGFVLQRLGVNHIG